MKINHRLFRLGMVSLQAIPGRGAARAFRAHPLSVPGSQL